MSLDLIMVVEHRFHRTPDGVVRTRTGFTRPFWSRYLSVFDRIRVVARVEDVGAEQQHLARADGDGVSFIAVPYYVGPAQYLKKRRLIRETLRSIDLRGAVVLLRVPGLLSYAVHRTLPVGHAFAVEVVGDPYEGFGAAGFTHPLRRFFQWYFSRRLRALCREAGTSLYVTQQALQRKYPPGPGCTFGVADVEMPDEAYIGTAGKASDAVSARRESATDTGRPLRVICVGTLEQLYKRQDVLIRSVASCRSTGLDVKLTLIGGGRKMPELQALTERLGMVPYVDFKGTIATGAAVREQLDAHDLFVLPSVTEGMPRAMLEAMARGLPCIGTEVGGIPELLPAYALVPHSDVAALAERIASFARDRELRERAARENFATAYAYHESELQPRRVAFFRQALSDAQAYRTKATRTSPKPE